MAAVRPDDVRDRIKLTSTDISDDRVWVFIRDAATTIKLELGETVEYSNCSEAEAVAIRNLAAIYCAAYVTGGASSGFDFTLGQLSVRNVSQSSLAVSVQVLKAEMDRVLEKLKGPAFVVGSDD
jgi:Flp pilus assembly CpaF family ATPase